MVSQVSNAASHAGEVSRVLPITTNTPLSQSGELCRVVRLRVARVHRHSMGNQGKLAAGHAKEPVHVQPTTTPHSCHKHTSIQRCRRSRLGLGCYNHWAWMHIAAACRSSLISLTTLTTMKVTCMSSMGRKYHRHMRSMMLIGSQRQ